MEEPEKPRSPYHPTPERTEDAYNRLAAYRFARRYVEGKSVADLDPQGTGKGGRILAETARSVASLVVSAEALEKVRGDHPVPNLTCKLAAFPELPFSDESLDVVVALEVVEDQNPESLVAEARRVLKEDGTLIVSAPDKQAFSNRRAWLYAGEFRELLWRSFERVDLYRQGAVSGTVVLKDSAGLSDSELESVPFAAAEPDFGDGPPDTDLVLAVCGSVGLARNERSYLLLDRDRRLLDECENSREDIELLKAEIQQMQKTEVKTFHETLAAYEAEVSRLRGGEEKARELRRRLEDIESSRVYRLLGSYRSIRIGLNRLVNRVRRG